MQDFNIRLRRYNGVDYDTLYPITKTNLLEGNITKAQLEAGATYSALQVTLYSDEWDVIYQQSVQVTGVTATNAIIVAPSVNSIDLYSENGIVCISQSNNTLTFKCNSFPATDINVNVLILT